MRPAAERRLRLLVALVALLAVGVALAGCDRGSAGLEESELGVLIDSLLPTIAAASGLEVRSPVRHALQSRADARAYIQRQIEEELGTGPAGGMERAYREFGLVPDTLDLRALLLELYTEQVVGYYDPRSGRLYVVEGVRRWDAAPVVAHELVHALQDQHVDLDDLVHRRRGNDRRMAAQAAAEGQATVVMLAIQAAAATGEVADPAMLPDMETILAAAREAEVRGFPVLARAPRIIRETLLFPYVEGATFVQALYRHRPAGSGPPVPFGELLPTSTRQVMNPVERFIRERDEPTEIRLEAPGEGWVAAYENTMGMLEMSILLAEHLGPAAGSTAGWDGDRYLLLDGPAGERALVWFSVWDDGPTADAFADRYRRVLERRGGRAGRVVRLEHQGRPIVRIVDAPAGTDLDAVPVLAIRVMEERPEL